MRLQRINLGLRNSSLSEHVTWHEDPAMVRRDDDQLTRTI